MLEEKERSDKELKVDESKLSEEDRKELHKRDYPIWLLIAMGVIVLLMIACIIVILNI